MASPDEPPAAEPGEPEQRGVASSARRVPVLRISLANASALSALYLLVAVVVELLRRFFNYRWAERLSRALEEFPARVLHLVGVFEALRDAYLAGQVNELEVRLIYGATVVAIVFSMGMAVGALMWALGRALRVRG